MPKPERKHSSLAIMQGANKPNSYAYVFAKLNALFKKADGHNASGPRISNLALRMRFTPCTRDCSTILLPFYGLPAHVLHVLAGPKSVVGPHANRYILSQSILHDMLIKPVQTVYGTPLFDQFYRAMPQTWTFPRSFGYKLQQRIKCVVTGVFFPPYFLFFPPPSPPQLLRKHVKVIVTSLITVKNHTYI